MRLKGKKALITGATSGIGSALARGFEREGAEVWVHGRDQQSRVPSAVAKRFVAADLEDSAQVATLAQEVIAGSGGRLDILVNNAGFEVIMPFPEIDMEVVERIWRVNVRAAVQLTHALLPALRASGAASVINVTSIHQAVPYPQNSAYCMSKAALGMFSQTAAVELAPFGIRINNLAPGAIKTDMNRKAVESMAEQFAQWIPAGRVGSVEEMVGPAVFLATDESSYMTGATLVADGGYCQNLVRYRAAELNH